MSARSARHEVTPVVDVLIGGFCGSAAGYEGLRQAMHDATGNTTIYIGMTRWRGTFARNYPYPRALFRQALHAVGRLDKFMPAHRLRLYGHSMGGAVALIAGHEWGLTQRIDTVVALNPAGLYIDGVVPLLRRMIAKGASDLHLAQHHPDPQVRRIIRAGRLGALSYMANPVRSVAEGIALARTPLFTRLMPRLSLKPIQVAVGYSSDDIVFVPRRVRAALDAFPGINSFVLNGIPHDVQYMPAPTVNALCEHDVL